MIRRRWLARQGPQGVGKDRTWETKKWRRMLMMMMIIITTTIIIIHESPHGWRGTRFKDLCIYSGQVTPAGSCSFRWLKIYVHGCSWYDMCRPNPVVADKWRGATSNPRDQSRRPTISDRTCWCCVAVCTIETEHAQEYTMERERECSLIISYCTIFYYYPSIYLNIIINMYVA